MALWLLVQKEKAFLWNSLVQKAWLSCAPVNWEHKLIEYDRLWSVVRNRTVAYSNRRFDDLFGSIVIIFKAFVYRQLIVFYSTGFLIWMVKSTNGTKLTLILSHPGDHILLTKTWLLGSNHFLWKRGYEKKTHRPVRERGWNSSCRPVVTILRWLVCNGVDVISDVIFYYCETLHIAYWLWGKNVHLIRRFSFWYGNIFFKYTKTKKKNVEFFLK